jgi:hypothetical protein
MDRGLNSPVLRKKFKRARKGHFAFREFFFDSYCKNKRNRIVKPETSSSGAMARSLLTVTKEAFPDFFAE